ncbi:MAG: NDP-sugar synthase [bacterium]|nr:NDP-sugar synthase [bacterium]
MKAFILAAGEGTRLRPLTLKHPKPIIPIMDKPVIQYTLENLKKYGIEDCIINLHFLGNKIKNTIGDGKKYELNIKYSFEEEILGTAGGVKKVEDEFKETFIVLSGDGLSDIDLSKLIQFHKNKKATATIAVKSIDVRFEYGVVLYDKKNRVKKFLEKPSWKSVFSNMVNCGIYVFEPEIFRYIPENKFYDFGSELLPLLVEKGERVFAYELKEYWCDVGNLKDYSKVHNDIFDGKVKIELKAKMLKDGVYIGKSNIDKSVKLKPPCYIGDNVEIKKNAEIGPYTVICSNVNIGKNTTIKNSIIWNRSVIYDGVRISNTILGFNTVLKENFSIIENAVIYAE